MNYINSSVCHWFVFCEAFYLYRLLRARACKDHVRWYIAIGWSKFRQARLTRRKEQIVIVVAPLILTLFTYAARFTFQNDWDTCWFEPSIYDWILHGPNILLQIVRRTRLIGAVQCYHVDEFSVHEESSRRSTVQTSTYPNRFER